MKPSITICPASVPVMVEDCPAARRAMAKAIGATVEPNSGARSAWASFREPTPVWPVLWNAEAARP